jgi:hypothetical protein
VQVEFTLKLNEFLPNNEISLIKGGCPLCSAESLLSFTTSGSQLLLGMFDPDSPEPRQRFLNHCEGFIMMFALTLKAMYTNETVSQIV